MRRVTAKVFREIYDIDLFKGTFFDTYTTTDTQGFGDSSKFGEFFHLHT